MAERNPQFSILIPTSGRPELIRMAVRSVLAQRLADFEVVVVVVADVENEALSRAAATENGDPRVRFLRSPEGGLSTWDFAARQARGEYILWLDDDNYLLPYALTLLAEAVDRSGADIISANHFYYYDHRYPRRFLRQSMGVIPFSGRSYSLDPKKALESLFSFSKRGPDSALPRLHIGATIVSRRVVESALKRLGAVVFTDLPHIYSLQPILFAFANSYYYVDHPVVIVGRLGVSMSQIWSTAARKRFKSRPFPLALSPVSGYARINTVLEGYLRAKRLLPDLLGGIPIDLERFSELYLRELALLDADLSSIARNWVNFFRFLETLPPPTQSRLKREAVRRVAFAPCLYLGRRLGLHHLWRIIYGFFMERRSRRIPALKRIGRKAEFSIPVASYGVTSIEELGARCRDILLKETGRDISVFSRL